MDLYHNKAPLTEEEKSRFPIGAGVIVIYLSKENTDSPRINDTGIVSGYRGCCVCCSMDSERYEEDRWYPFFLYEIQIVLKHSDIFDVIPC